jgi:hypothetical protein
MPDDPKNNVCNLCPHYASAQRGMAKTLPVENNGRIFLVILPIAVVAAAAFLLHVLIIYFRP